jgi:hypothetical protein
VCPFDDKGNPYDSFFSVGALALILMVGPDSQLRAPRSSVRLLLSGLQRV